MRLGVDARAVPELAGRLSPAHEYPTEHAPMKNLKLRAMALVGLLSVGCVVRPEPPLKIDVVQGSELLPWLNEQVTREEVLLRLGTPAREFEQGRILCYLLCEYETGVSSAVDAVSLLAAPRRVGVFDFGHGSWAFVDYDLVLVFGDDGRLSKQRLFKVH